MGVKEDFATLQEHADDADFAGWLAGWQARNPDGPDNGRYQPDDGSYGSEPFSEMECQPWLLGYALYSTYSNACAGGYDWVSKDPLDQKPPLSVANMITLVKANPAAVLHKKTLVTMLLGGMWDVPYIQYHDLVLPVLNEMLMAPKDLPSSVLADYMFGLALAELQGEDFGTKLYSEPKEGNKMRCKQGMLKVVTTAFALEDARIAEMDPAPTTAAMRMAFTTTLASQTLWEQQAEDSAAECRYLLHEIARAPHAWAWELAIDLIANASQEAAQSKGKDGNLPVHLAAQNKFMTGRVLAAIIKANPKGAKEKGGNGDFPFPLHCMAKAGDVQEQDMAAVLELFPGSVKEKDGNGALPIHLAASNSTMTEPVLAALIKAHPDGTKEKDGNGALPIHLAASNITMAEPLMAALIKAHPDGTKEKDKDGYLPIDLAATNEFITGPVLAAIIKANPKGANDKDSDDGWTYTYKSFPLHYMANARDVRGQDMAAVLELFPGSAKEKENSELPIHLAASNSTMTEPVMAALIAAHPDGTKERDFNFKLPIDLAVKNEFITGSVLAAIIRANPKGAKGCAYSGTDYTHAEINPKLKGVHFMAAKARDVRGQDMAAALELFPGSVKTKDGNGALPIHLAASNSTMTASGLAALIKAHPDGIKEKGKDGNLPIHLAIKNRLGLNAVREVYAAFPGAVFQKNADGVTPLHLYVGGAKTEEYTGVLIDLFSGAKTTAEGNVTITHQINDPIAELNNKSLLALVVELGFDECAVRLIKEHGASSRDAAQLAELSHNPELRQWGVKFDRLLSVYRLVPGKPKHVSPTCVVIFATRAGTGADKSETPVALKLMEDKAAFMREIDQRKQLKKRGASSQVGNRTFCISVIKSYADKAGTFDAFPALRLSNEIGAKTTKLRHMLVMERGNSDLTDIISHSNIAGVNPLQVTLTLQSIAKSLQELNDECSVMHGDVKGRNFVVMDDHDNNHEFAAIDLDAAAKIDGVELAGQKQTSSGFLPPEQAAIVLWNRRNPGGKKSGTPPAVVASPQYDMWAFGVMAYQLVTGHQLFNYSVTEEAEDKELEIIVDWTPAIKKQKLKRVKQKEFLQFKKLLGKLLSKDPDDRFDNWSDVLDAFPTFSSGGTTEVLAAIADLKVTVTEGFKENKALHATMLGTMKAEFDATRKFMVEMEKIDHPYVFEVLTPDDVAKEKADEAAEEAAAFVTETALVKDLDATAQKDIKTFHKKISKIKRFYNRSKKTYDRLKGIAVSVGDFAGDPTFEAAGNVVKSTKKGKTFKLRLLCGITFEPIIEYEFDEKEYGENMKKLAKVGSTIAQGAVMLASVVNPISSVAGFFGYPIPKIPVEKIKGVQGFLDDIQKKDTSEKFAGMKKAQDGDGLNLKAMGKLKAMIEKLEKEDRGRDCRPPPTDEREKDAYENGPFSWKSGLTKCQDPKNKGMVTFMDARLYQKHGGKGGAPSWQQVGPKKTKGKHDRTPAAIESAANVDGFGFGAGSGSHGSSFGSDGDFNDGSDFDAASDHGLNGFGDNEEGTFGGFDDGDTARETGGSSSSPHKTGARPRKGARDDVQAQILDEIKEMRAKLVDLEAKKRSTCVLM